MTLLRILLCLVALAGVARAAEPQAIFDRLASTKYDDIEAGVGDLATSGLPAAADALSAALDGRLLVAPGKPALFKTPMGTTIDVATNAPAAAGADAGLKPVRVNNRIRRAVATAIGTLTLMSPDARARLRAAESVFRGRDPETLPALDKALAAEKDERVLAAMRRAKAAITLTTDAPEADKVAAVGLVAERGDQDGLVLLRGLSETAPAAVKSAAASAIQAIETRQAMLARVQDVAYGVSLGSVLLLAAVGLAITFGVMGVINMAHGEMVMLGAYTTYLVQDLLRTFAPGLMEGSLAIAVPAAFLVAGAVGVAIERLVIRHLYGRPLETLLATFGISLMLQQAVRSIFGPSNREVSTPDWLSGSLDLFGLTLTWNRVAIVLFALAVFFALQLVLKKTTLGLQVRAVTQNRRMASSMGIRTDRIDALTFGLGSGVAGMAGVALSQIDNVSPNLGQGYIIDSFMVVVFGGVGNLWGTLVGALTIGVANKLLEPFAGAVLGKIILLVMIILFIQKRPRGLFALKGRFVDA
ncbi:urea ABC transporter permease subunit UrtB [Methylopila turkensis]|uniref:Branched-chain amino acid ABC transporter permease n=1 Tax=Methylopila turkensis TaxID=1437816 RepID=A0A9W6N6Z0_9HYPH|nr:urea ABC transporter permease subunit UrtB [Methylopila turkensis]GLK79826.1 branched-chain amino acid ABC transporter permease [Methylopila turkensis]